MMNLKIKIHHHHHHHPSQVRPSQTCFGPIQFNT